MATPFFSGDILATRFRGQDGSTEFGNGVVGDTYTFQAGLDIVVPLARRGARAVAALERLRLLERDASQLALEFQSSTTALRTVLAYWDLRASQDALATARRSVELQSELLALTGRLIAAGELPQTDVARAQAAESR